MTITFIDIFSLILRVNYQFKKVYPDVLDAVLLEKVSSPKNRIVRHLFAYENTICGEKMYACTCMGTQHFVEY